MKSKFQLKCMWHNFVLGNCTEYRKFVGKILVKNHVKWISCEISSEIGMNALFKWNEIHVRIVGCIIYSSVYEQRGG